TRRPVKLPGPVVTAIRSSSPNPISAASITRAMSGMSASACPRVIGNVSLAAIPVWLVSRTAAEQTLSAVSMARTRIAQLHHRAGGCAGAIRRPWADRRSSARRRAHFDHIGQIMAEQILDAMPQCRGGGGATGAGALHIEVNDAILETAKRDVSAVI